MCSSKVQHFRFDMFGIYVVMFLEILKTLVQVIFVFSILIIAFGLSFYILISRDVSHIYSKASSSHQCTGKDVSLTACFPNLVWFSDLEP